jgi:alcohol dehydrogenase (cytochrome c)
LEEAPDPEAVDSAARPVANVEHVIRGKSGEIRLVPATFLCRRHVLLEDVRRTAKRALASALAASITDATATRIQSAPLDAMAAGQVTVDRETRQLPDPFPPIATGQSIEYEGNVSPARSPAGADVDRRRPRRTSCVCTLAVALVLSVAGTAVASGARAANEPWTSANGGVASQREVTATMLDAVTISRLTVRWRFRLPLNGKNFGSITANPIIRGNTVYVQDSSSSLYALDARTGVLLWKHTLAAPNDGPNGLTVAGSRVYSATDSTAFALDAVTGRRLWARTLTNQYEQFVAVAPVVDRGRVYVGTQGFPPGGRGALYALSAATGRIVWRFQTIKEPWPRPEAGGGGIWYPVSIDKHGDVYAGIANPSPWGGSKAFPNGGVFAGPALYSDSLVVLAGASGALLWYDQVTPHDVRDYDFQVSPILATVGARRFVFGAGKGARVVAWDRTARTRLWSRAVGTHLHDLGPLPRQPTRVCPGLLGGVLTPMAYAGGRLFVPVVELCMQESAVTSKSAFARPPAEGKGTVYALAATTGKTIWQRQLGSAPFGCATVARDAVIVPTYDGRVVAFAATDGRTLWHTQLRAGNNSCPAVGRDILVVAAGALHPSIAHPVPEVVAFGLGR